jgi:WD40 repeat protein
MSVDLVSADIPPPSFTPAKPVKRHRFRARHSAPSILPSISTAPVIIKPNYKLLYQTHSRLHSRFLSGVYRLSTLQTRGASPTNTHTSTIYCLQLYTYPTTGVQVLFTGSRDQSIREWNLATAAVERVITGVHESSILSVCAHNGLIASAGSDRQVVVWDLTLDRPVKIICDHEDSVLCVRFDDERLVSCSKGTSVSCLSHVMYGSGYYCLHRSDCQDVPVPGPGAPVHARSTPCCCQRRLHFQKAHRLWFGGQVDQTVGCPDRRTSAQV